MPVPTDITAGTLTITNGSTAVTGVGTAWLASDLRQGDIILWIEGGDGFQTPILADVPTSNTALTLVEPWEGPTLIGARYRIRYQWDSSRVSAQSRQLIELLDNGNILALSGLTGPGVPVFNGPHSMIVRPETDFINGVAYDVQVNTMADRAAYDGQAAGFAVLVADVGDDFGLDNAGRSAVFSKASNTVGDWTDPAYVTGPPGLAPTITADVTVLPSSGTAVVNVTPISGGYDLDFQLPAADGFYWEGTYNSANAYPKDSVVRRNGTSFIAVQDAPIGEQPSGATPAVDTEYWEVVAAKGVDGAGTIVALNEGVGIDIDATDPTLPIIKLQDMPTLTVKGRVAGGTGAPGDLTGSQVTTLLDVFDTTRKGLVPQPTSGDATAGRALVASGAWVDFPEGLNYDSQISALSLALADLQGSRLVMKGGIADPFDDESGIYFGVNGGIDTNTVLMLHGDGADASTTFTDSSLTAKTVVRSGTVEIDTAQSKFGGASILFNGTLGNYLSVADSADWDFGTGDFAIDGWIRLSTTGRWSFVDVGGFALGVDIFGENDTNLVVYVANSAILNVTISSLQASFHHLAVTRSGGTLRAFVDGVQVGTGSASGSVNSSSGVQIGQDIGDNRYRMTGWLDEIRISKGVARWTANFTPPIVAYSGFTGGALNQSYDSTNDLYRPTTTGGTPNNMTLISVGYPVTVQPTEARLVLQLDTALTVVAGTDFSGEVSRDDGVTWTNAPLTLSSTLGNIKTYESDMVDLSAQPSGTIMKWRAKTLTNKNIAISGIVMQWR